MKNKYNKTSKPDKKAAAARETRDILKRLANPKKILEQEAANNKKGDFQTELNADLLAGPEGPDIQPEAKQQQHYEPIINQTMDITEKNESVTTEVVTDEPKKTDINLSDSGFFEPVIEREYAEKPQTGANANGGRSTSNLSADLVPETPKAEPVVEIEKPKILFAPKLTLKTDDTYKKVMGDETPTANLEVDTATDNIPAMQFQEATFNLADDAPGLGRQMGEQAGNTTSEWAFGMLENFYPEVVAFFTKMPTDWIEKAKLPNALEADTLGKILAANARNKNKVKISDFHKKNILPPLQRILAKKGWENVMPDELLLVIGLVVLAADSFFKIQEIKKENKVLEKQIKQKIQEYIDIRTEERKEIDSLKGELTEMRNFFANMKAAQQPAAA
jgi:hypothetical protein